MLAMVKGGPKTTNSGNFFASLASRDGWAGALAPNWRLAHDSVRNALHARKPMAMAKESAGNPRLKALATAFSGVRPSKIFLHPRGVQGADFNLALSGDGALLCVAAP